MQRPVLQDTAYALASCYITFSLLLCGFYVPVRNMVLTVARALTWASFSKYTFEALTINEFKDRTWSEGCTGSHTRELFSTQELLIVSANLFVYVAAA